MTGFTFKLPLRLKPVMVGFTTFLAGYSMFDTVVPIMHSASILVWKPINKIQCIHNFFLAKKHHECVKICRSV